MRLLLLASLASLAGGGAFGQSLLGQSQPGGGSTAPVVLVPEAPKIVSAPASLVPPPLVKPAPPPPGLVETPLPPPDMVQSAPVPSEAAAPSSSASGQAPRSLVPPNPVPSSPVPSSAVPQPVFSSPAQSVPAPVLSPPVSASASPAPAAAVASDAVPPAAAAMPVSAVPVSAVPVAGNAGAGTAASAVAPSNVSAVGASASETAPAGDVAPVLDEKWVYGHVLELGVLNKVDGSTKILTIPVGGQAVSGDLSVSVQACVVHPPGTLPNVAAFLTLQSTNPAIISAPIYRGWMVKSVPGAADVENADEAFRIISCS